MIMAYYEAYVKVAVDVDEAFSDMTSDGQKQFIRDSLYDLDDLDIGIIVTGHMDKIDTTDLIEELERRGHKIEKS